MLNTLLLTLSFLTTFADATPCNDGWESPSSGSGTCSHHGGIAGGSIGYYPTYNPANSAPTPAPVTQAPWKSEKLVSAKGNVIHRLYRDTLNTDGQFATMRYACITYEVGQYEESLSLGVAPPTGGYKLTDSWIESVDDNSSVHVYAVKGNVSTLLPSWEARIHINGGPLILFKWTAGITFENQLGLLFLTQGDLRTIEQSEDIYITVMNTSGSLDGYKIPMDGFSAAVGLFRKTSCTGR